MCKNLLAKYYQDNKERLKKKTCERYQSLSKEEKEVKHLSEDDKLKKFFRLNFFPHLKMESAPCSPSAHYSQMVRS